MLKKIILVIGGLLILVGLLLMYAGYNMAQGHFYGVVYCRGDYTTFYWGCLWLLVGIFIFIGNYIIDRRRNKIDNEILDDSSDESSQKKSRAGCVPDLIRVLAIFNALSGLFLIIAGITHEDVYIIYGIGAIFSGVLLYGLSYIIDAAIIYINKQKS